MRSWLGCKTHSYILPRRAASGPPFVADRDALIVDDFTVTCGTLAETAEALLARGVRRVRACVSHCLLTRRACVF